MNADVLIIGASLAGSAAAITAASAGLRVVLVEKAYFPRRKGCGDGLSGRGLHELAALGISLDGEAGDAALTSLPHAKLDGYWVWCGRALSQVRDRSGLVGIARSTLDAAVLTRARSFPNIEVLEGEEARVLEWSPGGCVVRVGDTVHRCARLIIADGAQSSTLRRAGVRAPSRANQRLGVSSVWGVRDGTLPHAVSVFMREGGEMYVTPVGGGLVNVAALGTRSFIAKLANRERFETALLPLFERIGAELQIESAPLGCGAIGSAYRGATVNCAFVVGDACETFDPCSGMGMTHALLSGRLAGEALVWGLGMGDLPRELARYNSERTRIVRAIRGFTRLSHFSMTTRLGRVCFPLFAASGAAGMVAEVVHRAPVRGNS